MTLATDVQKLEPGAIVELFELDLTTFGGDLLRFHAGTNGLLANVTWDGEVYTAFPVAASGFEFNGQGQAPRPKMMVSNVVGAITALVLQYEDLVGAKVTRRRTLAKYLDSVNFPPGRKPQNLLTFTRSSTATYYNSAGLVATAANNVPRLDYNPTTLQPQGLLIEEARTNTLTSSETFSRAGWNLDGAILVANIATSPTGTQSASSVSVGTGNNRIYQFDNSGVTGSKVFSIYAKSADGSQIKLSAVGGMTPTGTTTFDLSSGTVSGFAGSAITSVGNGWYRCTVPVNVTGASGNGTYWIIQNSGNSVFIWGAQLEAGAFPTSYIPSTNTFTSRASTGTYYGSNGLIQTAAINVARYNYNPANLTVAPTLLLEAAATNLLTYSEEFENATAWAKIGIIVAANSVAAPDGTLTADTIIPDAAAGNHYAIRGAGTLSATETHSVYAKTGGHDWLRLSIGNALYVWFNLSSGTIGTITGAVTPSIQPVGNGWYRCSISGIRAGSSNNTLIPSPSDNVVSYTGDGVSGVHVWGAQLETGSGPTSYIPTVAATVTRSADLSTSAAATRAADYASINTLAPWYNATEGTLHAEYTLDEGIPSASGRVVVISGVSNVRVVDIHSTTQWISYNGTTAISSGVTAIKSSDTVMAAAAYASGDYAFAVNGNAPGVASSPLVYTPTAMRIGSYPGSTNFLNGHVSILAYYPTRLSNTDLQTLTSGGTISNEPSLLVDFSAGASDITVLEAYNPTADPSAEFPHHIFYIDRKSVETNEIVEFELAPAMDVTGVMLPRRQIIQNICPWKYRGSECGYTGTNYFDTNDASVGSLALDACGKRLTSCKTRFGQYAEIPYGGFPVAGLFR